MQQGNKWVGFKTIDGTRYKRTGPTKTAVKAKFAELTKQIHTGAAGKVVSTLTVARVLDDFLDRELAGRDRTPSTVVVHRWAAGLARHHIGKKKVATLKVRDVDDMLDRLSATGLSRASLTKVRGTLSQALRFAVKREDITRNVAADATIPAHAPRTRLRNSLTPNDARTLLAALRDERNGALFALSLRLGLRPGEAAGLYWEDLDADTVNVTRAVRLTKGHAEVVDDLKTETARRTIALPAELVELLASHRKSQTTERLAARTWIDDRLMFASPTGNVLSPPNVRRQLADICKRADVEVIRPNELRHSCASLLSDIGVPNESIADLLGHTTTRMVDSTYRHRLRPVVSVAAEADWTTTG